MVPLGVPVMHRAVYHLRAYLADITDDTACIFMGDDFSAGEHGTVAYLRSRVELAHDAAEIVVAVYLSAEGAADDLGRHVGLAADAAVVIAPVEVFGSCLCQDAVAHVAVLNDAVNYAAAFAQMTANEAGVINGRIVEIEHGRLQREVAHPSTVHISEEAGVVLRWQLQSLYGMSVAVKVAAVALSVRSDRHKLALGRHVDVCHKARVDGLRAAVNRTAEKFEMGRSFQLIIPVHQLWNIYLCIR